MNLLPSCRYAMLVCYLPPLPATPFAIRQTPLSRLQLDRRLALLLPEDAADLAVFESMAHWDSIPLGTSDQAFLARVDSDLDCLTRPTLREMLLWRLELRTLVGALRRRQLGLPAPGSGEAFGLGECLGAIRRHWLAPDFRLGYRHSWVPAAHELLRAGQHDALERLLFSIVWDHYSRLACKHHFDFEAVVLYVLRWNLIDRLTRHEATAAVRQFEALLEQGLEGQGGLSLPDPLPAAAPDCDHA